MNAELPTKKGDYFEGHVVWDTCTIRKPDVVGIEIMHVKENDYFTPVAEVSVSQSTNQSYLLTWPKQQTATSRTTEGKNS